MSLGHIELDHDESNEKEYGYDDWYVLDFWRRKTKEEENHRRDLYDVSPQFVIEEKTYECHSAKVINPSKFGADRAFSFFSSVKGFGDAKEDSYARE